MRISKMLAKEASPGQIIEINKNDPSTWTKKPNKKEKDNE